MNLSFFKSGSTQKTQDPVCLMQVDKNENAPNFDYKGQTYYFCSKNCKEQFKNEPEKYLS